MPFRGIIFILAIVTIYAVIDREKIYKWLTSVMSDDNKNNSKEKEE